MNLSKLGHYHCSIPRVATLDKPAANDKAGAANTTTAVDGSEAAVMLSVSEDGDDGTDEGGGHREGTVRDREVVVLDVEVFRSFVLSLASRCKSNSGLRIAHDWKRDFHRKANSL